MDDWNFCSIELRKFLRDWGPNFGREVKVRKDGVLDSSGHSAGEWQLGTGVDRYL